MADIRAFALMQINFTKSKNRKENFMEQNNNPFDKEGTVELLAEDIVYPKWAAEYDSNPKRRGVIYVEEYTGQNIIDVVYGAIHSQLSCNPKGCLITGTFEGKEYQHDFINLSDCCADDDDEE